MHTSELFAESEKVERFEGSLAALEGAVDPQADEWFFRLDVISLGLGFEQRLLHLVLAKLLHLKMSGSIFKNTINCCCCLQGGIVPGESWVSLGKASCPRIR